MKPILLGTVKTVLQLKKKNSPHKNISSAEKHFWNSFPEMTKKNSHNKKQCPLTRKFIFDEKSSLIKKHFLNWEIFFLNENAADKLVKKLLYTYN